MIGPWRVTSTQRGVWWAPSPANWDDDAAFPSWREAYDYAHTHPSNRKETTT